jgi:hypothetical protein
MFMESCNSFHTMFGTVLDRFVVEMPRYRMQLVQHVLLCLLLLCVCSHSLSILFYAYEMFSIQNYCDNDRHQLSFFRDLSTKAIESNDVVHIHFCR